MAAKKKKRRRAKGSKKRAAKKRKHKGHVPLHILKKRLVILSAIVKKRS